MKRSKPPRADPEKIREWQDRSRRRAAARAREKPRKALPKESAKRKKERPARRKIVDSVRSRGCVARDLVPDVPCFGPIVGDEIVSRARRPGGHLDAENVQPLCVGHNGWKEDHPDEAAELGIAGHSWEVHPPSGD